MAAAGGKGLGAAKVDKGIRLLSLDGGPDAMPTVLTLKSLMQHIQEEENDRRQRRGEPENTSLPKPCDCFELIGGSGHGGIIALMLGPLRMGIDDAERQYATILTEIKRATSPATRSDILKVELRRLVATASKDPEALLLNSAVDGTMCRTFVTAFNQHNMNGSIPTLFRTYDSADSIHADCKIWEAGRATTALPGVFDSINIGRDVPYIGGLSGNNPTIFVLEEAADVLKDRKVACVVSIGTGHPETINLSRSSLTQAALDMAKDCEKTHEDMVGRFANHKGLYHRFNVQQGLQMKEDERAENTPEVESHTHQYILSAEVTQRIREAAKMVVQATGRVFPEKFLSPAPARKVDGLLIRPSPPSRVFIGRKVILEAMEQCFVSNGEARSARLTEQKRFVLCGLGGSGKTQLALKFIQLHSSKFTNIFVINASSEETINAAWENIGLELGLPEPTPSDTRDHLCRVEEEWLLLFDNADDPSVNLHEIFPPCNHGNIIITSRNQQSDNYAQPAIATHSVQGMTRDDSVALLTSLTSRKKLEPKDLELLPTVAETLGYLALALVQCGSYVATIQGMTFTKYLATFTKRRKDFLSRQSKPPVDQYQHTVYTTWEISFDALSPLSKSLLNVCSFFHFDGITSDIFSQAAVNYSQYAHLRKEGFGSGSEFLARFSPATDEAEADWDDYQLNETIMELTSYSLMHHRIEGLLSIHPLVQSWCKDSATREDHNAYLCTAQAIGALSIGDEEDGESYLHQRLLLPHLHAMLAASVPPSRRLDTDAAKQFAFAFGLVGQHDVAERLWVDVVLDEVALLGRDHPDTLNSMNDLANTYTQRSRHKDAGELQQQLLQIRNRVLGPEHPDTLITMHNLAATYWYQGQLKDACGLQLRVVEARMRVLGLAHPKTLSSMQNLANFYAGEGRHNEAEELHLQVLEVQKRVLGLAHPETFDTMSNLANTYTYQARYKEAEKLQVEVLETRKFVLGPSHPETIKSINNLAVTYGQQGRYKDAEGLHLDVLETRKRVLGSAHSDTLSSMHNLAFTYAKQGRLDAAIALMTETVNDRRQYLGPEHPSTLSSIKTLEWMKEEPQETIRTALAEETPKDKRQWWDIFAKRKISKRGRGKSNKKRDVQ